MAFPLNLDLRRDFALSLERNIDSGFEFGVLLHHVRTSHFELLGLSVRNSHCEIVHYFA